MPELQFDDNKNFGENLEIFLKHMDKLDGKLGAILRAHIDNLKGAFDERTRREARMQFNDGVVASLDELLEQKANDKKVT